MCTTVLVGKKASRTGSTMIARNADAEEPIQPVKFIHVKADQNGKGTYRSTVSEYQETYPEHSLAYHMIPFIESERPELGIMGEAGINSLNIAMSSTESIFGNPFVLAIDPLTKRGLGEDSLLNMVLPYIHSAREGVTYTAKIIAEYGSHEGNGIIFSDKDEIWYMEIPCGHHWVAVRLPDDCCAVIANQSLIEEVDFTDTQNVMYSEGIQEFMATNHLNPDYEGFNFRHIFGTSSKDDRKYNTARVWYGQKYLGLDTTDPTASDMPFCFKPNRLLTVADVGAVLSSHYDETCYDPFNETDQIHAKMYRPIAMNRTAESHILEIRNHVPAEIAALFWLNSGPTAFNPYVPFYTNSEDTAPAYNKTSKTYDNTQTYWLSRELAVLVERDYQKLSYANFDYLTAAAILANQCVAETDRLYQEKPTTDPVAFLTKQNQQNADKMLTLTKKHIGELIEKGLALSKLTFDITKDV